MVSPLFVDKDVEREFRRWEDLLPPGDRLQTDSTVGAHTVLAAHFLLVDAFAATNEGIGGVGPRSLDLLESAVGRQHTSFAGQEKWTNVFERCATLLFGLVKNHPFHDANKRTGLLVALAFLHHNKYTVTIEQKWLDKFVVAIAESKLPDFLVGLPHSIKKRLHNLDPQTDDERIYAIADFLQRITRREVHIEPIVTFNSLNAALKRHGFELANPNGNYIDICRIEPEQKRFLRAPVPARLVKLGQVGFPSWKSKVSRNAMKTIRTITGLTVKNGCDTDALFNGEEPMSSLISEYMEPLKRLAYK